MGTAIVIHRFGPFRLEAVSGRLFRHDDALPLADPHAAILLHLVEHAGQVVSRDALATAGWGNAAVAENSVNQAISRVRKTLADGHDGARYIETVTHHGYRFTGTVERGVRHRGDVPVEAAVAPYRAFIQGRRDLDTLDRGRIARARAAFAVVLEREPDYAPAHTGLGFAAALAFESTYVDVECDLDARAQAVRHARIGTDLAPSSGEAWSVLAFALYLNGERDDAVAAALKAVTHEPDDVRHWLRLGYVGWGQTRLDGARKALLLCPDLGLAHWLTATVLIARGAFDAALASLRAGCAAQDAHAPATTPLPAVGLHLLRGLVFAAQDRADEAADELERELASVDNGLLYARECAANTWYARGALRLRQRRHGDADAAFHRALDIAPGHLPSAAVLGRPLPHVGDSDPRRVDVAIAHAIAIARAGRHADAAAAYREAMDAAPWPSAGWILPVEPLLHPAAHPAVWTSLLSLVRFRAM